MRKAEVYITSDNIVHETLDKAIRHAENRYGNLLTSLAHKFSQIDKYKVMTEAIENHLPDFQELAHLKMDIILTGEQED